MATLTRGQITAHRRNFAISIGTCLIAMVAVHWFPKGSQFADPTRLFLTAVFFTSAGLLLWQLLGPRRRYLQLRYQWKYSDAPKPLQRAGKEFLYSLDLVISVTVYLLFALLLSIALMTYAHWFNWLKVFAVIYNPLWWIALIGLFAYPLFGGFLFNELGQRYRALHAQTSTISDFKPRGLRKEHDSAHEAEPLKVERDGSFRAGGIHWRWRDFSRNCIIFGMPGSGKTSCVLNALLEGILAGADRAHELPSGLILDPKGDFRHKIDTLCRRYHREQDLVVIDPCDPKRSIRWNPFDCDDDELELAGRFAAVLESLGMEGGENTFWIDAAKRFVRYSIALVRLTNSSGEPPCFRDLLTLVSSLDAIADRTERLDLDDPNIEPCLAFFSEWMEMPSSQRSGIQSQVTNMIDPFLMEPYASMFSGKSTCRIADILKDGRLLYVHMPIADRQAMARTIGTFVKLEYFREVLKSLDKPRQSFFLCDEFQQFFTTGRNSGDADFFERSRQSNHANLIASQNIPGMARNLSRREPIASLLGNCGTKIFLRNDDQETNEYASKLFGQEIMAMGGIAGGGHGGRGMGAWAINHNDQYVSLVNADELKELTTPQDGVAAPFCETLVFLGSRDSDSRDLRKYRWPLHFINTTKR